MMKLTIIPAALIAAVLATSTQAREITDSLGRTVAIPEHVDRLICSGAACVRLVAYLQAADRLVGVDDNEHRVPSSSPRAYLLANPHLGELPLIGQFRGRDNPELIVALDPAPQIILKTLSGIGISHDDLEARTDIPVVAVDIGDLTERNRPRLDAALRLMGDILGREERAEAVIDFIDEQIAELDERSARSTMNPPGVFVGGILFQGAQGFNATEPAFPPFELLRLENLASGAPSTGAGRHAVVAKEQIISWDPQVVFLDLFSARNPQAGSLEDLRSDEAYQSMTAVQTGDVWGLLPNTIYNTEIGSVFANAWFIGSLLLPDTFGDVDPAEKAREIETFLVGAPVFDAMDAAYEGMVFQRIPVR